MIRNLHEENQIQKDTLTDEEINSLR